MVGAFSACLETETPEPSSVVMGEWAVDEVVSNGQVDNGTPGINAYLLLESNNTYVFVNINGTATYGTYSATESNLTLTSNDNIVEEYSIEYVDWQTLHLQRSFAIAGGSEVEIRYVFHKNN
jgi:hypothetical protein